jgi:RNA-directed DNA polymerase
VTTEVERIVSRARGEPQTRYPELMHPLTVDNLRASFEALDGTKAPGVGGVTKAMYGQNLEANRQEPHQKLHQMSYRPQQMRRVEIPKEDGTMRPLRMSCTEDKIVQEMARRILKAIYESVFVDTSYGCRPWRCGHEALQRLSQEVMSAPVNGITDLDLARVFDTMLPAEIIAVLSERSADRRFLRLSGRMLKAGVQMPGGVGQDELGVRRAPLSRPLSPTRFWTASGISGWSRRCPNTVVAPAP